MRESLLRHFRREPPMSLLVASGLVAPVVYFGTVAFGGAITPGYDHASSAISELLIGDRAPLIEPGFAIYNLLMMAFAWALFDQFGNCHRLFPVGAAAVATGGALGLVMSFFPMDAIGTPLTPSGSVHIAIATLMSLASMAVLLCFGLALRSASGAKGWSRYALASLVLVFVSGGFAALGTAAAWPMAGLLERLTIGTYLLWIFVMAGGLVRGASGLTPAGKESSRQYGRADH